MITEKQLKLLIKAHFSDNKEDFCTIVLRLAAQESKAGNKALATDLRKIIQKHDKKDTKKISNTNGLTIQDTQKIPLSALTLNVKLKEKIVDFVKEYRQNKPKSTFFKRKILLSGPEKFNKSMTARALANKLHLQLHIIPTIKSDEQLYQIFSMMQKQTGIYLFKELENVNNKKLLKVFFDFLEKDPSESIVFTEIKSCDALSSKLIKKFDDIWQFSAS